MKKSTLATVVCGAVLVAVGVSCDGSMERGSENSDGFGETQVVTEHRFSTVAVQALKVGQDCSGGGPRGCLSGRCLKMAPSLGRGYFCSQECGAGKPLCPNGWKCSQAHPSPNSEFCVPPADWKGGVAVSTPPTTVGVPDAPAEYPDDTPSPEGTSALNSGSGQ